MRTEKFGLPMTAKQRNVAIILCTIAFFTAFFFTHRHIDLDDYDRLML